MESTVRKKLAMNNCVNLYHKQINIYQKQEIKWPYCRGENDGRGGFLFFCKIQRIDFY